MGKRQASSQGKRSVTGKQNKRQRKVSLSGSAVGRKSSYASSSSSASSYKPRMLYVTSTNSLNGIGVKAISSKGAGKVTREGRKKRVKVNPKLRKQVNAIIKPFQQPGTYMEIFAEKFTPNFAGGQSVFMIGNTTNSIKTAFDPNYILHAASVLWNTKTPNAQPQPGDGGNFLADTFKTTVIKQTQTHRFKNNTARTMYMKLYIVSPKGKLNGTVIDPVTSWFNGMKNEEGSTSTDTLNLGLATPNTLYATPYMSRMFMNQYDVECKTVVLEAGKEYTFSHSGPNMKDYELAKYFDSQVTGTIAAGGNVWNNHQKFVRYCFVSIHYDLAATSTGAPSRNTNIVTGAPYGLVIETTNYLKLTQPDIAGFQQLNPIPGAGTSIQLTQRKFKPYFLYNWTPTGTLGATGVINDNNPVDPIAYGF